MANIVCIASGTLRDGINNLGDIVDIFDDDVVLGPACVTFEIINVSGMTKAEVIAELNIDSPEVETVEEWIP